MPIEIKTCRTCGYENVRREGKEWADRCQKKKCRSPYWDRPYDPKRKPEYLFWKKVKKGKPNECWEWIGAIDREGYGHFGMNGKTNTAQRYAYEFSKGKIPKGLEVCHVCDNPPCVNPKHLWLGTHLENMQDCKDKGRNKPFIGKNQPNGQNHWNAKVTQKQVNKIREMYATGKYFQREIGEKFLLNRNTVRDIINFKSWKT